MTEYKIVEEKSSENESELNIPSILNDSNIIEGESKSFIEDFTDNNLVISDEAKVFERHNLDDDPVNVYMSSIIDQIESVNMNIDRIYKEKSNDRKVLEDVQKHLVIGNVIEARKLINSHIPKYEVKQADFLQSFFELKWPEISNFCTNECIQIQDNVLKIKEHHIRLENAYEKRANESKLLKDAIYQQNKESMSQISSLTSENTNIKDKVHEYIKRYGDNDQLKSCLAMDMIENCGNILEGFDNKINDMEKAIFDKNFQIEALNKRIKKDEIGFLSSQIDSLKSTQDKLQEENLGFSDAIQKLSEKNVKLKKDLNSCHNELKKSVDVIKRKSETISRQKTLIEMLQNKFSRGRNYPIEDLKRKKDEIRIRLEVEKDMLKKQLLEKEMSDCDRRLSDFLDINKK